MRVGRPLADGFTVRPQSATCAAADGRNERTVSSPPGSVTVTSPVGWSASRHVLSAMSVQRAATMSPSTRLIVRRVPL